MRAKGMLRSNFRPLASKNWLRQHGYLIEAMRILVRGDRDSRANLMPIYGDLYQIKL